MNIKKTVTILAIDAPPTVTQILLNDNDVKVTLEIFSNFAL